MSKTPRYDEWRYLREHGQWSDGVPDWARDHFGSMNDLTAATAVIEELALLAAQPIDAEPVSCVACEGKPSGSNIPCAVCGSKPIDAEPAADDKQVDWVECEEAFKELTLDLCVIANEHAHTQGLRGRIAKRLFKTSRR